MVRYQGKYDFFRIISWCNGRGYDPGPLGHGGTVRGLENLDTTRWKDTISRHEVFQYRGKAGWKVWFPLVHIVVQWTTILLWVLMADDCNLPGYAYHSTTRWKYTNPRYRDVPISWYGNMKRLVSFVWYRGELDWHNILRTYMEYRSKL